MAKRKDDPEHPLSPEQFDVVMAQYASTQPMPNKPTKLPLRSPGSLERKR